METDILVQAKGLQFPFALFLAGGEPELSRRELIEIQVKLRFLQAYITERLGEITVDTSSPSRETVSDVTKVRHKKEPLSGLSALQDLIATTEKITAAGPRLADWVSANGRRKFQMKSSIAETFRTIITKGPDGLELIEDPGAKNPRNRATCMLWLVSTYASVAHALLVICTFSADSLEKFSMGELTAILVCLIQSKEQMHCEALETEASGLLGG